VKSGREVSAVEGVNADKYSRAQQGTSAARLRALRAGSIACKEKGQRAHRWVLLG